MNLQAHLQARLTKLHSQPELINFMFNQGFHRESINSYQCEQKPFLRAVVVVNKINGQYKCEVHLNG